MALTTPQETIDERPSCCTYSSGRVFYGVKNTVYFSQIMEGDNISLMGRCYQKNDPTAEQLSDILETDGGTVQINGAIDIVQLEDFNNGILIYCTNGVWFLSGPESGFSATNFFVRQISRSGCISAHSVVKVEDIQYYWSSEGIYRIAYNEQGIIQVSNITELKIQTLYNAIPKKSKKYVNGSYNRIKKQVEWFYTSISQDDTEDYLFSHDRALLMDVRNESFWPQSFNVAYNQTDWDTDKKTTIVGGVSTNLGTEDQEVLYYALHLQAPTVNQSYSAVLLEKTKTDFEDYGVDVDSTNPYPTAYLETGYESLGKPSNVKEAPYTVVHFKRTEQNWVSDGGSGFVLDNQSACQFRSKWDWNTTSDNGRWGPAQQAYRFRRLYIPSGAGTFDSGEDVVTTKNKVLGRGKALSFRFEQEANKDMQLLGYTTQWSISARI